MKDPFRIRCFVLVLFMMSTVVRCEPIWTNCEDGNTEMKCLVHSTCLKFGGDKYVILDMKIHSELFQLNSCSKYVIVRAVDGEKMHIEIREGTAAKTSGMKLESSTKSEVFTCVNNEATTTIGQMTIKNTNAHSDSTVRCDFEVSFTPDQSNTVYSKLAAEKISYLKNLKSGVSPKIDGLDVAGLAPCPWHHLFFTNSNHDGKTEDSFPLVGSGEDRGCKDDASLMYSHLGTAGWVRKRDFLCSAGKISVVDENGTPTPLTLDKDKMKCIKKRCGYCSCPSCGAPMDNAADCVKLTCPKYMLIETVSGKSIQDSPTLTCSAESTAENSKWEDTISKKITEGITNVTCVESKKCSVIDSSITNTCPEEVKLAEKEECGPANLLDTGDEVCGDPSTTRYLPVKREDKTPLKARSFKCNTESGQWTGNISVDNSITMENMAVFCITQKVEKKHPQPKTGGITGGTLIIIIVVVVFFALVGVAIVAVVCRKRIKNKRDKVDLKSVSVTGRSKKAKKSKKDKKDKKGKKSSKSSNASNGSKSSE